MLTRLKHKIPHRTPSLRTRSKAEHDSDDSGNSPARGGHLRRMWSTRSVGAISNSSYGTECNSPSATQVDSAGGLKRRSSWWKLKSPQQRQHSTKRRYVPSIDELEETSDEDLAHYVGLCEEEANAVSRVDVESDEYFARYLQMCEIEANAVPLAVLENDIFFDAVATDTVRGTSLREETPDRNINPDQQTEPDRTTGEMMFLRDGGIVSPGADVLGRAPPGLLSTPMELNSAFVQGLDFYQPQSEMMRTHKECVVCADEKNIWDFPDRVITDSCTHPPSTCLECLATHIHVALRDKMFHDQMIGCPECGNALALLDVQEFADTATFAVYAGKATQEEIEKLPGFFRCPGASCASGQFHETGQESPIVTCVACRGRYCFQHRVPWHETLSCDEYDQYLASPQGFKSKFEHENERVEQENDETARRRRRQEDADRAYAQELLEGEAREEARRQVGIEKRQREARERAERERRAEEQRRADEKRRQEAEEARRRAQENELSRAAIEETTKPCPKCASPIYKINGCDHMTCSKCRHEFCWMCFAPYRTILRSDNSRHRTTCPFYAR